MCANSGYFLISDIFSETQDYASETPLIPTRLYSLQLFLLS